jgi:hypothetical protein
MVPFEVRSITENNFGKKVEFSEKLMTCGLKEGAKAV